MEMRRIIQAFLDPVVDVVDVKALSNNRKLEVLNPPWHVSYCLEAAGTSSESSREVVKLSYCLSMGRT